MAWRIREASPEDAADLERCMQAAYAVYQQRMGGERLPPMDVDYASEIANYPAWVAESEDRIVGGLIMVFADEHATIANIAVDPEFQGQGIGSGLLGFAETVAKKKNYTDLQLATHVLLKENIALYRHLGWQERGSDRSKVFMQKTL